MSTHKTVNSLSKGKKEMKKPKQPTSTEEWASRSFTRSWTLSDETEVRSVTFEDGLLNVTLGKVVPEHHTKERLVLNTIEYRRRRGATGTIQLTPLFFLLKS